MGVDIFGLDQLTDFLIKAKKATYASGKKGEKLPDCSEKFSFSENRFKYVDRFYGGERFGGREIVFYDDKPVWFIGYYGGLHLVDDQNGEIYAFLRKALLLVGTPPENPCAKILPVRGPERFKEGDFVYENNAIGDLKRFQGSEVIWKKSNRVYILEYSGGILH